MPQIDRARIRNNAQLIYQNNGETAILKRYVSASNASPRFGIGTQYYYNQINITGLFAVQQQIREAPQGGGTTTYGQLYISTPNEFSQRDEIVWRGSAYRVDGSIQPENIGGRVQYRAPIVLAARTGA